MWPYIYMYAGGVARTHRCVIMRSVISWSVNNWSIYYVRPVISWSASVVVPATVVSGMCFGTHIDTKRKCGG